MRSYGLWSSVSINSCMLSSQIRYSELTRSNDDASQQTNSIKPFTGMLNKGSKSSLFLWLACQRRMPNHSGMSLYSFMKLGVKGANDNFQIF